MYCIIDVETGGLNPEEHSLLTACFLFVNDSLQSVDVFHCSIAHPIYKVTDKALEINKIDLLEHHYNASPVDAVKEAVKGVFNIHGKCTPVGWNVGFDVRWLSSIVEEGSFDYRTLDIQSIVQFYRIKGLLPKECTSLVKTATYFGIGTDQQHTAVGDCFMTLEVWKKLYDLEH